MISRTRSFPKVLLVEDNRSLVRSLTDILKRGYDLDVTFSGRRAIYKADTASYDIIILDLNLPDISGQSVCQHVRERGYLTPILILTAEADNSTKVKLLDLGANDYLTKPFNPGELLARLRVLTRNIDQSHIRHNTTLTFADLSLDRQTMKVSRGGMEISLRRKEFNLLECLMDNAGNVVSRSMLIQRVWNSKDRWTNTIEVHIKHLRDKIDRPFNKSLLQTVHGQGYKLDICYSKSLEKRSSS